jgi:hypothetical protein
MYYVLNNTWDNSMIEITNIQSLMPSLNMAVGAYFWKLVFVICATIPIWILTTTIKDWWILRQKRERLVRDSILSLDSYYEVDGHRGFLRTIGTRLIKLEEPDHTTHHIPIEKAVDGTVTKLHYKEQELEIDADIDNKALSDKIAVIEETIRQ